jgi:hypothetical protein
MVTRRMPSSSLPGLDPANHGEMAQANRFGEAPN